MLPLVGGSLLWLTPKPKKDTALVATVKRGDFRVVVTSAGEVRAPRFEEIRAPKPSAGRLGMGLSSYEAKILSLVPEGTIVKQGDFVAELDRSGIVSALQDASAQQQKAYSSLTRAKLDTTLNLSDLRDQIANLEQGLEERKLAKEQAAYEALSVRRQAQMELDKAERELAKLKANYDIKRQQAAAQVVEAADFVNQEAAKVDAITKIMGEFTIRSPGDGMVVYRRPQGFQGLQGGVRRVGSVVTMFDPVIATLPDLRFLESVTFINEIDIAKVAVGQPVQISLDGDPSKRLTGKVARVANMGEQGQNSDAKVFEVAIAVDSTGLSVRPGMTTSNAIETAVIRDVLSIPLETVTSEGDLAYVYKREGGRITRQQVELGTMAENEIIVRRGLTAGDQVLFTTPVNGHDLPLIRLQ